jgi:hypothetical protein
MNILNSSTPSYSTITSGSNPRNQVTEVIVMPHFDPKAARSHVDPESIELSVHVIAQLKSHVTAVACMYHDENPFHNYEHASHVTMSANK